MVQLVGSSSLGLGKLIDGKNQFVHIRYSAKADGSNMTIEIQPDTKYIGIRTSSSETPSVNPADYSWGRFVGSSGSSSYTWIRYSANEDGSNMTTIANEETKYIGVAITDEDSAPTDHTRYSWALFKGSDGRGVERTEVSYQKSSSGTVIPAGSWLSSIPSVNDGEYLWTRTLFFYTDETTTSTFSVSRNGTSGLGIARSDVHYQKSTSGTTAPTGTWTITIPTVKANEYLWTRTTTTYTDYSTSVSYSVGKMGADGKDAQLLYLTASSQIQAFDKDDRPKTTQPITISAKLQNASGTATFTATPYIGITAQKPITLGGTGNDRTLLPNQWVNSDWTTIAITATLGSLTDTVSIIRIKDGDPGNDGIPGRDGVGLKTTVITYGVSNSETTQPTTWSSQVPTLIKGKYLWTRTVWTYTDDTTETGYQKTYIARDGNDGIDGLPGKDGIGISSTTITYAASTSGTVHPTSGWSTTIPSVPGGQYLWTRTVWTYTDSTTETGYSVARIGERGPQGLQGIQGPKGDQGITGPTGADGRTSYTHIAYANSADGNLSFSTSDSNRKYIGIYVDFNQNDSTNPSSYQWSLIKGADGRDGADGLPGKPGADGRTPYFHTAYANSADGSSGFSTTDSNGKLYLGTCTDYNKADPTDYRVYTWTKIKGEQGNGISSTTVEFYLSTSKTTQTGGSWSTTQPTWSFGKYLWTRNKITYTDGSISYTTPQCSSEWEAVNESQVGGINLWRFTKDYDGSKYDKWGQIGGTQIYYKNWRPTTTIDGFGVQYITTAWGDLSQRVPVKPNTEYTLSAMIKLGSESSKVGFYVDNGTRLNILVDGQTQPIQETVNGLSATEYRRVSVTFNTGNANYSYARFEPRENSSMYMYQPMFNEGKPKPWSPHPEDIQGQIDNIQIGGRNLLKDTGSDLYNKKITKDTTSAYSRDINLIDDFDFNRLINKTITFSFRLKNAGNSQIVSSSQDSYLNTRFGGYITIYWKKSSDGSTYTQYVLTDMLTFKNINDKRIGKTYTITLPGNGYDLITNIKATMQIGYKPAQNNNSEWFLGEFKLELGNKDTDWSPAPEDMATAEKVDEALETAKRGAISGYLTNESILLDANANGAVTDFSQATGSFIVYDGQKKVTSGVNYSRVSQTGVTVSITNSGTYNVTAISSKVGTAILQATYNGVTLQKILTVAKAQTGATGSTGPRGPQGATGATGPKGDKGNPTGIVISATAPSNPYVNMLWKHTGSVSGLVKGATYRWNGSRWELYIFTAENISASSLSAITANLGTVTAGTVQGKTIEISLNNSQIAIGTNNRPSGTIDATPGLLAYGRNGYSSAITSNGTVYELSSGSTLYQMWMNPRGLQFVYHDSSSKNGVRYFNANSNGFEFRPATGATGIDGNTGIDLKGNITYVDFHWEIDSKVDFRTRLQQENSKFTIDSPYSNLFLKGGGQVRMLTPGVNVRNVADSAWAPVNASGFKQQSDSQYKYNIKDMPDRLNELMGLEFKAYRLWGEDGKYQEGLLADKNYQQPFVNRGKDGDYNIDLYGYTTFLAKSLQEAVKRLEVLENENASRNGQSSGTTIDTSETTVAGERNAESS